MLTWLHQRNTFRQIMPHPRSSSTFRIARALSSLIIENIRKVLWFGLAKLHSFSNFNSDYDVIQCYITIHSVVFWCVVFTVILSPHVCFTIVLFTYLFIVERFNFMRIVIKHMLPRLWTLDMSSLFYYSTYFLNDTLVSDECLRHSSFKRSQVQIRSCST